MTDVQELPWTTAPDLVDDALESLSIPDDARTAELAREYAQRYGVEDPIDRQPSSVAAGSIYLASMFERGRRVTLDDVQEPEDSFRFSSSSTETERSFRDGAGAGAEDSFRDDDRDGGGCR